MVAFLTHNILFWISVYLMMSCGANHNSSACRKHAFSQKKSRGKKNMHMRKHSCSWSSWSEGNGSPCLPTKQWATARIFKNSELPQYSSLFCGWACERFVKQRGSAWPSGISCSVLRLKFGGREGRVFWAGKERHCSALGHLMTKGWGFRRPS